MSVTRGSRPLRGAVVRYVYPTIGAVSVQNLSRTRPTTNRYRILTSSAHTTHTHQPHLASHISPLPRTSCHVSPRLATSCHVLPHLAIIHICMPPRRRPCQHCPSAWPAAPRHLQKRSESSAQALLSSFICSDRWVSLKQWARVRSPHTHTSCASLGPELPVGEELGLQSAKLELGHFLQVRAHEL